MDSKSGESWFVNADRLIVSRPSDETISVKHSKDSVSVEICQRADRAYSECMRSLSTQESNAWNKHEYSVRAKWRAIIVTALSPLTHYVNAEDAATRHAAYLRTYAERIRNGTEQTWEIPNTRAATLEVIADRLVRAGAEPAW